jgi:hypothetical protein
MADETQKIRDLEDKVKALMTENRKLKQISKRLIASLMDTRNVDQGLYEAIREEIRDALST